MKNKKTEINCTTGEVIEREMTKEELDAEKALQKIMNENLLIEQAQSEAKAAEKQAILDRIGLTADELKTILG
jgi:hypothetical protein